MTNSTLGTQIASRYAELGKNVCGYDARVWNLRFFDAGCATKRSCPGSRRTRQNRHNLGENRSGYNAALLELLFLFCAARPLATASRLTSFGLPSASLRRISPESVSAKVMPQLERVAAVSALEDYASDAALSKPIVAEVYDKPERNVHQLHVGKQLGLVPNLEDYTKMTAADADLGKNRLWRSPRGNDMSNVSQIVESGAGVVATTVLAKSAYAKHLRSNSISLEV